jgi:branched-chain amino acid transport system substrate-binding protein
MSVLGTGCRDAVTMAVEERNAAGGIKGARIELLVRDDGGDPQRALAVDRELAALGASVVIGHVTSTAASLARAEAAANGILILSSSASSSAFEDLDDNFLRFVESNGIQAARLARLALAQGHRRVAAFVEKTNAAYSEDYASRFLAEFAAGGGSLAGRVRYTTGTAVQESARLSREALATGAEAFLLIGNPVDSAYLAQILRRSMPAVPLFAAGWAYSPDLIEYGGRAVEGLVTTLAFNDADTSPAFLAFKREYERRYGRPVEYGAVYAYEAATALFEAIAKTGKRDPASLKAALCGGGRLEGLSGPFSLNRFGDVERPAFAFRVEAGRFVAEALP